MTQTLLQLAEELEGRDERAAAEQAEVERLAAEVERTRDEANAAASFLAGLPAAQAAAAAEREAAAGAHAQAAAELEAAEAEQRRADERRAEAERLAAARAVQHARDALEEARHRLDRAGAEQARLAAEAEDRRGRVATLGQGAAELAGRLAALPRVSREAAVPPAGGVDGLLAWASQARGALLVAVAGLTAERERVAREAAELAASVSGDAFAAPGVAGVRDLVARSVGDR